MARKNIQLVIGIRYQQSVKSGKVYSSVYTLVPNANPDHGHIMRESFVSEERADEVRKEWEKGGGAGYYDVKEGGSSFQGKVEASVVSMIHVNEAVDWEGEVSGSFSEYSLVQKNRQANEAARRKASVKS